jgi:hypothetical protein
MSRHERAARAHVPGRPAEPGRGRPKRPGSPGHGLQTVTALLLTPQEFPGELGENFAVACAAVGAGPLPHGYGLVLAQDEHGGRWTQITRDAQGVDSAQSIWAMGLEYVYEPPSGSVIAVHPGWPVPAQFGLAGLGEPHDPPSAGGGVLRPPQRGTPGRRRGMADLIYDELADLRGRSMADYTQSVREDAADVGDNDPSPPPPRLIDLRQRIPGDHPAHQVVDHALAGAWSLAATTKPPPGSVRADTASPGKARLVRANGDGWTLIGRTDGPVILLTDALPGMPIDAGDAPRLQELLTALTAAAQRTAR